MDKLKTSGSNYNATISNLLKNPHKVHGISVAGAKFLEFLGNQYSTNPESKEKLRKTLYKNSLENRYNFNKFPPFINKPVQVNSTVEFHSSSEKSRYMMIQKEFNKLRINLD